MAQTLAKGSTAEVGAGMETGLGATTAAHIIGPQLCKDRESMHLTVHAAAKGTFNLNYFFSPDGGTTWLIGLQVAAGTVTVDGATALYVKSATMDIQVGFCYKVEIYNTSGSGLDYAFEYRLNESG